jgi:MFS family permease
MNFLLDVLAFPFRLIGKLVDLIGRAVVFVLGFVMMVLGVACCLSSLTRVVGIPLFIVGLLLVLRSLA